MDGERVIASTPGGLAMLRSPAELGFGFDVEIMRLGGVVTFLPSPMLESDLTVPARAAGDEVGNNSHRVERGGSPVEDRGGEGT